jgi:DNA gyrase subunit A
VLVNDNDEIMLITDGGTLVRTRVDGISVVGRNTQGVTIIRLDKKEKVIGVDRIEGLVDEDDDESEVDVDGVSEADAVLNDVADLEDDTYSDDSADNEMEEGKE